MSLVYKERWESVFLCTHPQGPQMSHAKAAKYLKISETSVRRWINRYKETGAVDDIPKTGRPPCTTSQQDQQIVKMADAEKPMTTEQIANQLAKKGVTVSRQTVCRRIRDSGLRYQNKTKKPLLTDRHIENRLAWARANIGRDWTRTIYSDECGFHLHYPVGRVWKRRGQVKVVRTVKHSAKVNMWGCFSSEGFGKLVIVVGTLESKQMCKIYEKGLLPSADKFFGVGDRNWELLEDGDSKHTSKLCTGWKAENGVEVIDWPANSPDCNPIENVWAYLKAKLRKKNYNSLDHLIANIKREWKQLSVDYARKLSESMDRRCQAVIDNGGDWTLY